MGGTSKCDFDDARSARSKTFISGAKGQGETGGIAEDASEMRAPHCRSDCGP